MAGHPVCRCVDSFHVGSFLSTLCRRGGRRDPRVERGQRHQPVQAGGQPGGAHPRGDGFGDHHKRRDLPLVLLPRRHTARVEPTGTHSHRGAARAGRGGESPDLLALCLSLSIYRQTYALQCIIAPGGLYNPADRSVLQASETFQTGPLTE